MDAECRLTTGTDSNPLYADVTSVQVTGPAMHAFGPAVTLPLDGVLQLPATGSIWVECSSSSASTFSANLSAVTLAGIIVNPS